MWGISRLYPGDHEYEPVDPYSSCSFELEMSVPDSLGSTRVTDTFKALITVEPTSFAAFEMNDITQIGAVRNRGRSDELGQLLDELGGGPRNGRLVRSSAPRLWTSKRYRSVPSGIPRRDTIS
jgi:hypothetical protein